MLQELFRLHIAGRDIPVFGYGLMLVVAFLSGSQLAGYLARRYGLDGQAFSTGAVLALFSGLVGARISHVLENLGQFTADPNPWNNVREMLNFQSGGLTYYGGVLLAIPVLLLYTRHKHLPLRLSVDILAPCLMIALGWGRVGCFLNGCCYGARCDAPWAVRFPYMSNPYIDQISSKKLTPPAELLHWQRGQLMLLEPAELRTRPELAAIARHWRSLPLHPTQLYSTFTAFLLAGLLLAYFTLPHAPGRVLALCLMLEGLTRFILELLRAEPAILGPFSLSMILGLGLMALGVVLWRLFGKMAQAAPAGGNGDQANRMRRA